MQEINEELNYISSIDDNDKVFAIFKQRFKNLIICFYNLIQNSSTTNLNSYYQNYKNKYEELLTYYCYEAWNHSKILSFLRSHSNKNINNLKNARTKMKETINNILEQELATYKTLIFDYNSLKPLINGLREGFSDLCLWGYMDIKTTKLEFKKRLIIEIAEYRKRIELVDSLKKIENGITPEIKELYNNIYDKEKFYQTYDKISFTKKAKVKIKQLLKF